MRSNCFIWLTSAWYLSSRALRNEVLSARVRNSWPII